MRILHISDRLSARGGADWHLLGVLAELAGGHDLLFAIGRDDGTCRPPCPIAVIPALAATGRAPIANELDRLIAQHRPDVVHIHNAVNPAALEWAADRGAVMTVQDHRFFCPGRGKLTRSNEICRAPMAEATCSPCFTDDSYFRRIHSLTRDRLAAVRAMRNVTVLSTFMKQELVANGVAGERITVIPPFVHGLDDNPEPGGPPCLLFAGRLVAAKGVHDAVAAWEQSGTDLPLLFAGTGSERNALTRRGCQVLGWVRHADLAQLYRRARAVIVPSRWQEPFGIVGLEALTLGTPVVAWDSGGVRDWYTGPPLVSWGDVAGLATAIRAAIGTCGRAPEGFGRAELMGRLVAVYDDLR